MDDAEVGIFTLMEIRVLRTSLGSAMDHIIFLHLNLDFQDPRIH